MQAGTTLPCNANRMTEPKKANRWFGMQPHRQQEEHNDNSKPIMSCPSNSINRDCGLARFSQVLTRCHSSAVRFTPGMLREVSRPGSATGSVAAAPVRGRSPAMAHCLLQVSYTRPPDGGATGRPQPILQRALCGALFGLFDELCFVGGLDPEEGEEPFAEAREPC